MTEYEMSRKAHGLHQESGDSDTDTDTDSEDYNSMRPPPYNYEDIKHKIVVVEAQNAKKNEHVDSEASLKRKGKKKKRWLPLTVDVIKTLEIKATANLHIGEKPEEKLDKHLHHLPDRNEIPQFTDLQLETENIPSTSKELNSDPDNEQTQHEQISNIQKFENVWGNFFYRPVEKEIKDHNEDNLSQSTNKKDFAISDNIKKIWSNETDNLFNEPVSNGAVDYIQNVWDNFVYHNGDTPPAQANSDKHEFAAYFSDDFDDNYDVKFECLEKEQEKESVSNCLSSIQEIMPEDLLNMEILTEFKHFLANFSNLNKTQQDIFVTSVDFGPILAESPVALYSLRIFNSATEKLVEMKPTLEQMDSNQEHDNADLNVSIETAENKKPTSDKLETNHTLTKISPSKNTNIVKPYNFIKAEKIVPKLEDKRLTKKVFPTIENKRSKMAQGKDRFIIEVTNKSAINIEQDDSRPTTNDESIDIVSKSEQNSLDELEIAEMNRTLNELELDDSSSESDAEFYDKTTKTVSFVILLSKVMYIILIVIPLRNLISFLKYLKSWPFVKTFYIKGVGQHAEVRYKKIKKKMKKFYKMYLENLINIKFCKTVLITLVSFHLFLKIESVRPFLLWFYDFYHVLVFSVLPLLFTIFEILFLKPLCWLYNTLFKDTFMKESSHIVSKLIFCLVAIYYIYKITTLILKGARAFVVQPFRKVKRYFKNQYEFLLESLILFQNQTFVTNKKERKERDFKIFKMRQIRRRN